METAKLYEAIFFRKSTRRYDFTPLDDKTLEEIRAEFYNLKPLNTQIATEFKLITAQEIITLPSLKAPYYVAAFSELKDGYLTNLGFMLQQLDLFLAAQEMGSCWQGLPKPTKEVLASSRLEFGIVLAFGKPVGASRRNNIGEFHRKPLSDITNIKGADQLLEPARLAPSGMNNQPWYFTGAPGLIHAYCRRANFINSLLFAKMNRLDMGIALCHLWLAVLQAGKKPEFVCDEAARSKAPSGYYYLTSLKVD
ncbi:MAG: nitroreductase [Firmicutes bacterium]|nr:nitroreductase [Bacillota bacterium]